MSQTPRPAGKARASWRGERRSAAPGANLAKSLAYAFLGLLLVAALVLFLWPRNEPEPYLLCLGVTSYDEQLAWPAPFRQQDLRTLASLQAPQRMQWAEQSGALRADDLANLTSLGREATAALAHQDALVCYVAAHGISIDGKPYLVGSDYNPREEAALARAGLCPLEQLLSQFVARPARLKLILLDAGGLLADPAAGMLANEFPLLLEAEVKKLPPEANLWVLCSHGFLETRRASSAGRYSLFARAVAEALRGDADGILGSSDARVQLNELAAYVCWGVQRATQRLDGEANAQTPVLFAAGKGRVQHLDSDAQRGLGQALCFVSPASDESAPDSSPAQQKDRQPPKHNTRRPTNNGKQQGGAAPDARRRSQQRSARGGPDAKASPSSDADSATGSSSQVSPQQSPGSAPTGAAPDGSQADASQPEGGPREGGQPSTTRAGAAQPDVPGASQQAASPHLATSSAAALWDHIVGAGAQHRADLAREEWRPLDYAPHLARAMLVRLLREEWLFRNAPQPALAAWAGELNRARDDFLSPNAGADLYDDAHEVELAIKIRNRLLFWLPAAVRYYGSSTPSTEVEEPLRSALERLVPMAQDPDANRTPLVRLLAALRPENSVDPRDWLENLAVVRPEAETALRRLEEAIQHRYQRAMAKNERRLVLCEELLQFALLDSQQRAALWAKLGRMADGEGGATGGTQRQRPAAQGSAADPADEAPAAGRQAPRGEGATDRRQVPALGASRFMPVLEASPPDGRVLPTASVNAVRIWNRLMRAARWEAGCLACIAQDDARKELLEVDQLLQTCELSPRGSSQLTRAVRGKAARAGVKLARLYATVPRSARKLLDQATPDADRAAELWFFLADDRQAENLEREVVARHPVTHPPELPLPREFRLELARDLLMASGLEADDRLIRGRPVQFHETALAWRLISRGGRARAGDLVQFRVQFDPESFEISHQGQTLASQQPRVWPGTAEQPVPLTLQITPRFSPGQSGSIALEALLNGEQVARTVHRIEIPPRRPPRLVVQGGAGSQPAEVMLHSQQLAAPGYVLDLYPFASGETEFALFLDPNGADQQLEYRLVLLPPARISEFRQEHWVWQASDAELGLSQPHVGPLAIELQAADGPSPLRFWPAPPPVPDGAPPAAPAEPQPRQIGGLLALFHDKRWQDEVRVWIRFDPHPGRYLNDPDVQFDAPSARNLLRVEARLRDHALLEQRDAAAKQIVVELLCDDPRARREDVVKQLKDAIGPNRPAAVLQLALGWLSSNTEETPLFLSVDGYPRAYAYRVQRRAGPFQKLREDFRDVRLLEVGPPAAFAAPAGSPSPDAGPAPQPASLVLEMPNGQSYLPQYFKNTNLQVRVLADAPPDDFRSGRLRLQVGLAPGWADAEPASPQYFFADRQVQISLLPKTPERLRVAVTVDDLLVTLDHTAFRNGRASIVARLVARDGTPQISKWAPVTFDEQAPSGREIQVTLRAEEVRRGRDVRIAAVDVADISGRAAWWAGIDKNGNGILDQDEEQEGGQDGTLNLATGELPNRNASYNVLVRVRDGAGNETPRDNCGAARFRLMRASEK